MSKIHFIMALVLAAALTSYLVGQNGTAPNSPTGMTAAQSDSNSSSAVSSRSGGNDASLTQQLQSKLGQDPAFANVQGSVADGTALITGTVASKADKKRADDLAKSISGIKHVTDQLSVNASAGASTSSKNNNQTDVNSVTAPNSSSGAAAGSSSVGVTPGAANPGSGETSATSSNPQSQASGTTGSKTTSEAAGTTSVNPKAAGQIPASSQTSMNNQVGTQATTGSSTGQAAGENASSAPQAPATGATESNMAGASSSQAASSTPATSGGVTGTTTASPSTTNQAGTNPGTIGTNAAAAPSTSVAGSPAAGTTGVGLNDTATLQGQIQTALQNEPTLRNDALSVNVNDSTIELSGNVQTGKEKQTAHRIASSFAGNRRVKDRITLTGHGSSAFSNPNSSGLGANPAGNTSNTPANNQNPNPKNPQNPSANNPAANGDASANPR